MATRILNLKPITVLIDGVEVRVDAADVWVFGETNWVVNRAGRIRQTGGKKLELQRFLMGDPDGMHVDHIDGDPTNNVRSNLRLCTHAENMRNRKIHSNNRSGYKGVYFGGTLWRAQIRANGKTYRLGYHKTPEDAYAAYQKAAAELHGEFARMK